MKSPDRLVPPEEGPELFKKLRADVAAGIEVEVPPDEPLQVLPTPEELAQAKVIKPKFINHAEAQRLWEEKRDEREEQQRAGRKAA